MCSLCPVPALLQIQMGHYIGKHDSCTFETTPMNIYFLLHPVTIRRRILTGDQTANQARLAAASGFARVALLQRLKFRRRRDA